MAILKSEQDEDQQPFLDPSSEDIPRKPRRTTKEYLRFLLEGCMALTIVLFIANTIYSWRPPKLSPVPEFPKKTYTFLPNPKYVHEDMFDSREATLHTLHNWVELSADGRGYVQVDNSSAYTLPPPIIINDRSGKEQPVYMMTVFHQLHCLSYLAQSYQKALSGENDPEIVHHSAHCFDYIRQGIMCAADTSLEGKTTDPGWDSKHVCKDYDEVLRWANEHTKVRWHRGPEEDVL